MFSFGFMIRALIVGSLISLSAALVGTPLVLKKNSMLGDGLSHVAFGAFALASVFGFAPLWVAIPVVIVASFFVLRINENSKIHGDSAVALMSASALAIGTFIASLAGTNTDSASVTGSVFTTGSLFLSGGIGLLLGAGIVALIFIAMKPKKKNEE